MIAVVALGGALLGGTGSAFARFVYAQRARRALDPNSSEGRARAHRGLRAALARPADGATIELTAEQHERRSPSIVLGA